MKIVFLSVTGQTRRFVNKLPFSNTELNPANPLIEINEPYILVVPTYDKEITDTVLDFIEYQNNLTYLKGVAGGGNRNFADLFIYTAKDISRDYHVPLLFAFEFSGTNEDVENFKKVVMKIESEESNRG